MKPNSGQSGVLSESAELSGDRTQQRESGADHGDMNISPTDLDIGIGEENRKRWLRTGNVPSCRKNGMDGRLLGWGLVDTWCQANPTISEHFSWFDYRPKASTITVGASICSGQPASGAALRETGIDYEIRGWKTVRPRAGVGHLPP